jgi:hypothetical protein
MGKNYDLMGDPIDTILQALESNRWDEKADKARRLCAAAPDLIESLDNVTAALETCLDHFTGDMPDGDARRYEQLVVEARAAIAKARGETE